MLPAGWEQLLPAGREQLLAAGREQLLPAGREQLLPAGREQLLPAGREQLLPAGWERHKNRHHLTTMDFIKRFLKVSTLRFVHRKCLNVTIAGRFVERVTCSLSS